MASLGTKVILYGGADRVPTPFEGERSLDVRPKISHMLNACPRGCSRL